MTTCVAVGWTEPDGGNGLIEVSTDGGAQWSSETVSPLLDSVSCSNVEKCIASGDGEVFLTDDGGSTWSSVSPPTSGAVSCSADNDCFMVGGGSSQEILQTTDGGTTWSTESWSAPAQIGGLFGGPYTLSGANLTSIACPSTSVCVAVGQATYYWNPPPETTLPEEEEYPGIVVTTGDGGQTWSAQIGPMSAPFAPAGLNAVSCTSTEQCLAVGSIGSYALTSDDEGATWSGNLAGGWPQEFTPNGLSCPDTSDCIVVGESKGGQYTSPVMSSSDGGATWTPQAVSESTATLQSVACVTDGSCWAVGGTSKGSIVLHTLTGGDAWPEVTGIDPASGSAGGGTSVTISGLQFDLGVTSVSFGTVTTTAFTVDSPTQITVTSPPMAEGSSETVDVTVNSVLGSSPPTPADQFTYQPDS